MPQGNYRGRTRCSHPLRRIYRVDAAEDNVDLCRRVNADGTRNIAAVCRDLDIKMMYISTDYVFNGQGLRPWEPDDEREPLNVYGQTKCEGEMAVEELVKKFFNCQNRVGVWGKRKELY